MIVNKKERGGCGSFLAPSCSVHKKSKWAGQINHQELT